jgi:hypothetical protein
MKVVLEIPIDEVKFILDKIEESDRKEVPPNLDEYVFVPIINPVTNNVDYIYDGQKLIINKEGTKIIEISIPTNAKHITKITPKDDNKIDIRNIVILFGYAVDEDTLGLVQTLDLFTHVGGFLVNGRISMLSHSLSKQEIIFSKDNIMRNLFFLKKSSEVELQNDVKISLITTTKIVRKSTLCSLRSINNEKLKEKIKGIIDLYGLKNEEDIEKLVAKLSYVIWYNNI